jgi:hypothetical protein
VHEKKEKKREKKPEEENNPKKPGVRPLQETLEGRKRRGKKRKTRNGSRFISATPSSPGWYSNQQPTVTRSPRSHYHHLPNQPSLSLPPSAALFLPRPFTKSNGEAAPEDPMVPATSSYKTETGFPLNSAATATHSLRSSI